MEDPAARKERLRALRQAAQLAEAGEAADAPASAPAEPPATAPAKQPAAEAAAPAGDEPVLRFRNYAVRDAKIEHRKVEAAQPPTFQEPRPEAPLVPHHTNGAAPGQEVLVSVAPKKANWDLRRDVQRKLDKLERRTQRALVQLMQQQERAALDAEGGAQD